MADNVELPSGSGGAIIATDDDGVAQHQYVKLEFGADNTQTKVSTANPLPVVGASNSGVDIGDVTVNNGVGASAVPIQDGGNSITVDGTVAVTSAGITTIAGAVAGTEMQVDVLTMPTVTVNAHAVTNAGTFVVQENGAALTSLQLIDDTVQVLGTDTYTEATSKGITLGAVRRDADTTLVNTTNEFGPLQMDANGRLKVEAFSGEALPVTLASTTITGTVAVTQSGTWDEVGINDSGNSITVDNGGTFATQVDGAALTALQLIDNPVLVDDAAFTPATSSVMMAGFEADEGSTDSVDEGDAGAARMTLTRKLIVTPQPHTAGGLTIFRSIDIDESEEEVKGTAGVLYSIAAFNTTAAPLWLKFYNLTAANTTVGTSTPVLTFMVPANADSDGAGFVIEKTYGWTFDTAISVACTTGVADADTGAPGANACVINLGYL